jgi:hypothetical protein
MLLKDRAAELMGSNRSQSMLAAAIKEVEHILADQTAFLVDNRWQRAGGYRARRIQEMPQAMEIEAVATNPKAAAARKTANEMSHGPGADARAPAATVPLAEDFGFPLAGQDSMWTSGSAIVLCPGQPGWSRQRDAGSAVAAGGHDVTPFKRNSALEFWADQHFGNLRVNRERARTSPLLRRAAVPAQARCQP